jgi:hypothetical protein
MQNCFTELLRTPCVGSEVSPPVESLPSSEFIPERRWHLEQHEMAKWKGRETGTMGIPTFHVAKFP